MNLKKDWKTTVGGVIGVILIAAGLFFSKISSKTGKENMTDYEGLYRTNPKLSLVMLLALFSLAGIPPVAGFFGKYFIFSEAMRNGYQNLVFLAIISSIIGVFYYMKVIVAMYSKPANEFEVKPTFSYQLVIIVCILLSIFIGIFPGLFTKLL